MGLGMGALGWRGESAPARRRCRDAAAGGKAIVDRELRTYRAGITS